MQYGVRSSRLEFIVVLRVGFFFTSLADGQYYDILPEFDQHSIDTTAIPFTF